MRQPESMNEWTSLGEPLGESTKRTFELAMDDAVRWLIYGDSLAATFDRNQSQVIILHLMNGESAEQVEAGVALSNSAVRPQ